MRFNKWFCLIILVCAVCFQSCKKGCNDPKAFNYDKNAKETDGSCLFCDSSKQTYSSSYLYVNDYNSSSPYYNQQVLSLIVSQSLIYYTGNGCKLLGKTNYNYTGGCNTFSYIANVSNQTNSTVTYSGDLVITPYSSGSSFPFTYHVSSLTIAPYSVETIYMGTNCSEYTGFNTQNLNSSLQYH